MRITLCIPLFNEESILRETMKTVSDYMTGRFGGDYEVIYIDDGSSDGSLSILREGGIPHTRYLTYPQNRGKGYAVRQGMLSAQGDLVIFTDCDLAYGCEVIGEMTELFGSRPELDAVIGSRALHPDGYAGYTLTRKLASKTYLKILSVIGGLKLTDSQSGIKGFRREMAQTVFSHCEVDRFAFDFEAILLTKKARGEIGEMPVKIINHRESTIHLFRDSTRMLRDLLKMKRRISKINL